MREDLSDFVIINKYCSEQKDGGEKAGQHYHCNSLPVISLIEEDLGTFTIFTPVNGVLINLSDVDVSAGHTVCTPVLSSDADVTAGSKLLLRAATNPSRAVLADPCRYERVSLILIKYQRDNKERFAK